MGDTSNATTPRKVMSEMEDTNMQKVGMRDDKEKATYEPYTSRERYYEQLYQRVTRSGSGVYTQWKYPSLTEQEPYVTGNPKDTRGTASGNRGIRPGVDLEDGIGSYCKYHCVHTSRCC